MAKSFEEEIANGLRNHFTGLTDTGVWVQKSFRLPGDRQSAWESKNRRWYDDVVASFAGSLQHVGRRWTDDDWTMHRLLHFYISWCHCWTKRWEFSFQKTDSCLETNSFGWIRNAATLSEPIFSPLEAWIHYNSLPLSSREYFGRTTARYF
jgi:hypothetical protein